MSYGHTMLKTPDPVRSPQLSNIWTSQYYGGGPHGNTGCCSFTFLFYFKCFLNISKTYCYNNHKTILKKFSISILFFFKCLLFAIFFSSALKYIYCGSFLFIFALQLITLPKKGYILFLYSLAPKKLF